MGSKQSKRSVDISGKDGEAAGAAEVVAAGGEGRVEPIADADTLKPQLNGDTPHIVPPEELSEKEKQLENGTPENEKDATTEKETVVTNGSGGDEQDKPEQENGDAKPTPESDTKKNKKEKVKKKWSFRSISFSRKEKPKQEKKQKDEEPKINGEIDKLPEEGTEAGAVVESKSSDDVKEALEKNKDEKTPETPVTEPITNGNSAPETPKEEAPAKTESSPAPSPVVEKTLEETQAPEQPDNLPLNGLSLDEPKEGTIEVKIVEEVETKLEQSPAPVTAEPASVIDTPIIEVCAGQSPLTEITPPPLPSNPPPSSLTAFAETTMAPHLVDASLTSQSQTSPPITATAEIASSIVNLPLLSKVDPKTCQSDTESRTTVDDMDVEIKTIDQAANTLSEKVPADMITNGTEALELKELTQEFPEPIKCSLEEPVRATGHSFEAAETSEINNIVSNEVVESIAPFDNLNNEVSETQNTITNGVVAENNLNTQSKTDLTHTNEIIEISTDSINNSLQQSGSTFINEFAEGNKKDEEKINESLVETAALADHKTSLSESSSTEMADSHDKPETSLIALNNDSEEISGSNSGIIIENGTCEGESPSEALPPPAQDAASESGEGNCGSNEEISESFPLPPSELCRSESEASGAATPEPSQEVAPVAEVIVPEILTDKALIADIKEVESCVAAASETVAAVTVVGAGDGAPSD